MTSNILTLDLGTKAGFAVGSVGHILSGVWDLKAGRFEGGGMRFMKFRTRLNELHAAYPLDAVFFEEVRNHKGVDAAHVYGGLMGILTEWCEENKIPYTGVPVGEIKRNWTGKGNANKAAMIAECERRGFKPKDDNEADAIAIFDVAIKRLHPELSDKEDFA